MSFINQQWFERVRHLWIGRIGEFFAGYYLKRNGYSIEKKHFRAVKGEIDIIAWDGAILCFVEVKTRTDLHASPIDRVDRKKRQKIIQVAKRFIEKRSLGEIPARFDVIEVFYKFPLKFRAVLHRNAFQDDDRYR